MMDCKKALTESNGDQQQPLNICASKASRPKKLVSVAKPKLVASPCLSIPANPSRRWVEFQCESAPVSNHDEFKSLATDLAKQLALGPGAANGDELLAQPSPTHAGKKLSDLKDDLFNRMREVFNVGRIVRVNGPAGVYAHHDGSLGALVEIEGTNLEAAKEIAMHIVAQKPLVVAKEDLDPAVVDKERAILTEQARGEGKPENIIVKMIEGRLKNFYAEKVLNEQPFIKDDKMTVGQYAQKAGIKIKKFYNWQVGK